jgi:hypothetical protein
VIIHTLLLWGKINKSARINRNYIHSWNKFTPISVIQKSSFPSNTRMPRFALQNNATPPPAEHQKWRLRFYPSVHLSNCTPAAPTWSIGRPWNASFRTHWMCDQHVAKQLPTDTHPWLDWNSNSHPSVQASEYSSCLTPRGHCDRL